MFVYLGADNDKSEVLVKKKPDQGTCLSEQLFQKLHQVQPPPKRKKPGSDDKEDKEYLDLKFAYFVGSGTAPLSISEDKNLRSFCKALNPNVSIKLSLFCVKACILYIFVI